MSLSLIGTLLTVTACAPTTGVEVSTEQAAGFPLTVTNCGHEVTVKAPPDRVMLLESASVTILDGIGVFDKVIARAGSFPAEYYDPELAAKIDAVPALSDDIDGTGHLMISQELVLAQTPDLVLGLPDGVSRDTLADSGAAALIQELQCPDSGTHATFDTLYEEIDRYGKIFAQEIEAESLIEELQQRVATVEGSVKDHEPMTAAVLYPSVGGGPLYAYGTGSMADPQLKAAGLTNIFADVNERVFEVQTELLVSRNPDVLILLYHDSESGIETLVTGLPGIDTITAVQEDQIITQLFNFTEPASPLTVTGLENIASRLVEFDQ